MGQGDTWIETTHNEIDRKEWVERKNERFRFWY